MTEQGYRGVPQTFSHTATPVVYPSEMHANRGRVLLFWIGGITGAALIAAAAMFVFTQHLKDNIDEMTPAYERLTLAEQHKGAYLRRSNFFNRNVATLRSENAALQARLNTRPPPGPTEPRPQRRPAPRCPIPGQPC